MEEINSGYKKLFSNTLIIAIGSGSSKVLMLLLNAIYARSLTDAELGVNEIIQQISNWLVPIFTFEIFEAVIRFGLDKQTDSRKVFTVGNAVCLGGFVILAPILYFVDRSGVADKYLNGYTLLIYCFIISDSLRMVYSYFLRALEKMRLFSIAIIVNTVLMLTFTVLFIVVMKLGNKGYLYSIIAANVFSVAFMFIAGGLWKYLSPKCLDNAVFRKMIAYSLPLIPAQLMWLVANSSDSFMTRYYMDEAATGILSQSYKIANIVSTVYLMFGQAWNMSAVLEDGSEHRDRFYENVFHLNQCMMYIMVAGCLMLCKPITLIWLGKDMLVTAQYAPILIYSTVFSCFTTFMGSIYLASNRTGRSLFTSVIAGVVNVSLNIFLIPRIGLIGPPITTVISFLVVFVIRIFDSRQIVPFKIGIGKLVINNILLAVMTVICVMMNRVKMLEKTALFILPAMFLLITAMNIVPVWNALIKLAPAKIGDIILRLGPVKIVLLCIAAAAFAVVCFLKHFVLTATCLIAFAGLMAFGVAADKRLFRLGGMAGLFITVWAAFGLSSAFLALLVLSAFEYLREPDGIVTLFGAVCLSGTIGGIYGLPAGVFAADMIVLVALIAGMKPFTRWLYRLLTPAGERAYYEAETLRISKEMPAEGNKYEKEIIKMAELTFEITKNIGVLSTSARGWTKELNLVSWNEREPKYDIREWNPDHSRMGKGVTLTDEEVETLRKLLNGEEIEDDINEDEIL